MPLIITFEVEPERNASLVQAIKGLGEWGILTPTCLVVETDVQAAAVMETLQPLLGPADSLWAISAAKSWAGYGDPVVEDQVEAIVGPSDDWTPIDWDENTQSRPIS